MIRLVRTELLRLRSRRAIRWLTVLVVGAIGILGVQAVREATQVAGTQDWVFVVRMDEAAIIVAVFLSVYGFLVGATYAGADWAAGTVQTLLTWEPRRVRVIVAKVAALTIGVLVVGIVLHALITGVVALAADQGGSFDGNDAAFWRRQAAADGRALALGVAISWLAFGIASLTRNTGVALGVGFVYFAILENILRVVADWPEPYLIGNAIAAWLSGTDTLDGGGTLTRGAAGIVLAVYSAGVVAVMTGLFARRDVT